MGWWSCIINGGKCTDTACDKTIADVQSCKKLLDDANKAKESTDKQLSKVKSDYEKLEHSMDMLKKDFDTLKKEKEDADTELEEAREKLNKIDNKEKFTRSTNYCYCIALIVVVLLFFGLLLFCSWRCVKITDNDAIEKSPKDATVDESEIKDNQ